MVSNRSAYSPGSKVPLRWAERQAFNAVAAAAGAGGGRAEQPVAQHEAQRLGLDFYERELTGRIMTRMTTDVDSLSSFFQIRLITMVNSVLTFAVVLIFMLITNLRLGLLLSLIVPPLIAVTYISRSRAWQAFQEARDRIGAVNTDL